MSVAEDSFRSAALMVWSMAGYLPDWAPVGSVAVECDGKEETYTFPPHGDAGSLNLRLTVEREP